MSDTPTPTEADGPDPEVAVLDDTDVQTDLIVTDEGSASDESEEGAAKAKRRPVPTSQKRSRPNLNPIRTRFRSS